MAALAATVALGPAQAFALEAAPAPTAETVDGAEPPASAIDPARIEVRVILDHEDPESARRIGDAMRAVVWDRMTAFDDELGPKAPHHALLRVVIDESARGQGFVGMLRLERNGARAVAEVECSPCGGTEFLAELRTGLDRTAATLAGMPDAPTPPPVVTPSSPVALDLPAPAKPIEPWLRWTGYLGFSGMVLTAVGGATLVGGASMLGAWAAGREPLRINRDVGMALAIAGGTLFVVGVPMFAVDLHRYRKARRATAATLSLSPMTDRRTGGLSLRGRF